MLNSEKQFVGLSYGMILWLRQTSELSLQQETTKQVQKQYNATFNSHSQI